MERKNKPFWILAHKRRKHFMNILLIDNFDSFTYNLVQLIEDSVACRPVVLKYDEVNEKVVSGFDRIVISPGPGIPDDFPDLQRYVRSFYATKSFLGICLGHEAIAMAFGAELENLGEVYHGTIKPAIIQKRDHFFLKNIPDRFNAGLYHSWALVEKSLPEELEVLATAEDGIIMAIAHRNFNLVGVQFHPESFMTEHGQQMIRNWVDR
jgi:anthranilate synthase component II